MDLNPYESPRTEQLPPSASPKDESSAFGVHVMIVYCVVHALIIVVGWTALLLRDYAPWGWEGTFEMTAIVAFASACPFSVVTFLIFLVSLANSYVWYTRLALVDAALIFIQCPFALLIPAVY